MSGLSILASAAALLLLAGCRADAPGDVTVFVAASMTDVATDLKQAYEAAHSGATVRLSVASTQTLEAQIAAGAPAGVFLAADPSALARLAAAGRLDGAPVALARGGLVAIGPPGAAPAPTLAAALSGAMRIALGDPATVPAGRAAKAALEQAELWDAAQPRLVFTSDVRAAVAAVETRAADAALVYASDALSANSLSVTYRLRADEAPPVSFAGAVVAGGGAAGRAFLDLAVASPRVWASRGFLPPAAPPVARGR